MAVLIPASTADCTDWIVKRVEARQRCVNPLYCSHWKIESSYIIIMDSSKEVKVPLEPAVEESHRFTVFGLSQVYVAIISSVLWMTVSSGLIMLNKELLSNGFPYPMALSGLGMFFSGIAATITCKRTSLVEAKQTMTLEMYATKIMPIGLLMALTLGLGNLVYLYLSVSLIQMLKCFTPVITMVCLFIARMEKPNGRLVASVCCIAIGTAIASYGAIDANGMGILIMMLSETFEAIRLVMIQLLLTGMKFHPIEGLMYLAPACAFWLGLGSLLIESRLMVRQGALEVVLQSPLKFATAAMLGFLVNSLSYVVIQSASSLTLKVLGTVKNAFVVFLGLFFLHETISRLQAIGYASSISAFYWYQRIKMAQMARPSMQMSKQAAPATGADK